MSLLALRHRFKSCQRDATKSLPTFLNSIRDRGFAVNIQDLNHDGRLFKSHAEFLARVAKINSYAEQYGAEGFRSAILYRVEKWFGALKFAYDMSVPNVAHLDPQRGGCCTVMPYFIGRHVGAAGNHDAGLHPVSYPE